ncbi:MAG: class I mannose-6-phosphate isomerase [Planctomycetaceae bacterium]|nr:class I mannose-6-phosphate isomerase [Planctomycetaceae bacterium]
MEPLVFEPILKRIRWGGRKLGTSLGKPIGDEADYAESWEIADHDQGTSVVASGPWQGRTLSDLLKTSGEELLGRQAGATQFPLLIKFLDANDWLSLQVHPDDRKARRYDPGENGKTEAWIIMEAAPDSRICCGLKAGVTREQLRDALVTNELEHLLHLIPVTAGDCVFVPAGTVHALGPGIVLAEIQQQSNLTFRLYDWGRMGTDGKPRPIHVEESLDCTAFDRGPVNCVHPVHLCDEFHSFEELVRCDHFVIRRHRSLDPWQLQNDGRFRVLLTVSGQALISTDETIHATRIGSTVLIPASSPQVTVTPRGDVVILEVLCP